MTKKISRLAVSTLAVAASLLGIFRPLSPVYAEPEIIEASVEDGAVLEAPPDSLRLCFSEPVKIEPDDSRFNVLTPEGVALGLRIAFETSGDCVDVYPGYPETRPAGTWRFEWLVHSQADDSEGSGVITFGLGEAPPGDTAPEQTGAANDDDGGMSTGAIVAIVAGVAVLLAASGSFAISRSRRRS